MSRATNNLPALINAREKTHGKFTTTAEIAQRTKDLWAEYGSRDMSHGKREALDHIATKIARVLSGDEEFAEHWFDVAGYGHLGGQ